MFRPWSLTPAPCPTTCATPLKNLKTWYHDLYLANRDVVQEIVYGRSLLGQPLIAYKVTQGSSRWKSRGHGHGHGRWHRHDKHGDDKRPAVLYNSTQHAREWIATEVERRLFEYVVTHKRDRSTPHPRAAEVT